MTAKTNQQFLGCSRLLRHEEGQLALEAFWGLNLVGGLSDEDYEAALDHRYAYIRTWAIRLLGDARNERFNSKIQSIAESDQDIEVRQQVAVYARRVKNALPLVAALLSRDDHEDIYMPLMIWWAIETHCQTNPDAVVANAFPSEPWQIASLSRDDTVKIDATLRD